MKKRKKGCGFGGQGSGEDLERVGGGKSIIRIYCMKETILSKIKTKNKKFKLKKGYKILWEHYTMYFF